MSIAIDTDVLVRFLTFHAGVARLPGVEPLA